MNISAPNLRHMDTSRDLVAPFSAGALFTPLTALLGDTPLPLAFAPLQHSPALLGATLLHPPVYRWEDTPQFEIGFGAKARGNGVSPRSAVKGINRAPVENGATKWSDVSLCRKLGADIFTRLSDVGSPTSVFNQ